MRRDLDPIDRKILDVLQGEGRLSVAELSRRVHLSKTPCQERVRRLERDGYIDGYVARLNAAKLGYGHEVFVQVTLDRTTPDVFARFGAAVRKIPEIQSCHMVAGGFDYLLKVRARDIEDYSRILVDRLAVLPGVSQTHTYVVLERVKDDIAVPLAG